MDQRPEGGDSYQWCERHWKPYKDEEANGIVSTMMVMEKFTTHPDAMIFCGYDGGDNLADTDKLNEALVHFAPVCCMLGDEVMDQILEEAKKAPPFEGPPMEVRLQAEIDHLREALRMALHYWSVHTGMVPEGFKQDESGQLPSDGHLGKDSQEWKAIDWAYSSYTGKPFPHRDPNFKPD